MFLFSATKPNNDNKPSPEIKPATEIVEIRRPEESEPEWEGFEAFSEASASEEVHQISLFSL